MQTDTTIYTCGKDIRLLYGRMSDDLRQLSNWFKVNKLSLNTGKPNYIVISCKNNKTIDEEYRLQINNVNIQKVNTTQLLGIHIDSTLQWHGHINHVQKIRSSGLYAHIQICAATNPYENTVLQPYSSILKL